MTLRHATLLALGAALALPAPAQAGRHPGRGFDAVLPSPPAMAPTEGAIFIAAAGYAPLVSGARAQRVGDVLTVILNESTTTAKTASGKTQRTGSANITPPTLAGLTMSTVPLNAGSSGSFNGQGNATQTNSFSGMLSVTIAEVRPNGTALVRGEKRMLLAQGKEWIQFSGIVRLADVDAANQVQSGQVADARIEYAGDGTVAQSAREGWLSKFFSYISPF